MKLDLIGEKYSMLTVLREGDGKEYRGKKHRTWICKCDCGNIVEVTTGNLRSGNTKSCGCSSLGNRKSNQYHEENDVVYVMLSDNQQMICDAEDWKRLKHLYWCVNDTGYAVSLTRGGRKGSKRVVFHNLVLDPKKGYVIDHANRNPLDNRKSNLRYASRAENSINSTKDSSGKSGYRGVYIDERKKRKYIATIYIQGKQNRIGSFFTLKEAVEARRKKEVEVYGRFSPYYSINERR